MCAQISDEVILSVTKLHLLKKHGQDVRKVLSGEVVRLQSAENL